MMNQTDTLLNSFHYPLCGLWTIIYVGIEHVKVLKREPEETFEQTLLKEPEDDKDGDEYGSAKESKRNHFVEMKT